MSRGFDASGRRRHVQDFGRAYQNATNVKPCRKHQCLPQDLSWIEWRHDDQNLPMFSQKVLSTPLAQLCTKTTHTHTKHKKKQKNTRALNHTTMPPLFYTQEILHRFHWIHFSLNFLPQTFRRTCLILWLLCVTVYLLADASICFNPLWSFMFFHWVETRSDMIWWFFSRCTPCTPYTLTTLHASGSGVLAVREITVWVFQAAVKMNPGSCDSCYIWSRFPRGKSRQQDM